MSENQMTGSDAVESALPETEEKFEARGAAGAKSEALRRANKLAHHANAGTPARQRSNKLLIKAIRDYRDNKFKKAALLALDATRADETNAQAYHVLALGLENLGQLYKALQMYERAFKLGGDDSDLFINLGLVAWRLGMLDGAETLFRRVIALSPANPTGYNNLAGTLRDAGRYGEAIDIVRGAIERLPHDSNLWNTVGTIMIEQAEWAQAETFFAEARRLDRRSSRACHNLGNALTHLSRFDEAIAAFDEALRVGKSPRDSAETVLARSLCLMSMGRVEEGFDAYQGRHHPLTRGSSLYGVKGTVWQGESLEGKRVGIICEQGLGDEIMFASVIPDIINAIGPDGSLSIASDRRLVPLFQRSFPQARCDAYRLTRSNGKGLRIATWMNEDGPLDIFFPLGDALSRMRRKLDAFPQHSFLAADPARVAQFRSALRARGSGPFVGICWRSMLLTAQRRKYFRNIDAWAEILRAPGVTFVNLQYGDCADELRHAREMLGVTIETIDGLDLKNDLDGSTALSAAVDLAIAAPTAAAALAAGVGTETWFVAMGRVWPQLGTGHYPWYRKTQVFAPDNFGDWSILMPMVTSALSDWARQFAASRQAA